MDVHLEVLADRLGPQHETLAGALLPKLKYSSSDSRRLGMTLERRGLPDGRSDQLHEG